MRPARETGIFKKTPGAATCNAGPKWTTVSLIGMLRGVRRVRDNHGRIECACVRACDETRANGTRNRETRDGTIARLVVGRTDGQTRRNAREKERNVVMRPKAMPPLSTRQLRDFIV
jgi:hypothetical protein